MSLGKAFLLSYIRIKRQVSTYATSTVPPELLVQSFKPVRSRATAAQAFSKRPDASGIFNLRLLKKNKVKIYTGDAKVLFVRLEMTPEYFFLGMSTKLPMQSSRTFRTVASGKSPYSRPTLLAATVS